jgi:hypothetical protein
MDGILDCLHTANETGLFFFLLFSYCYYLISVEGEEQQKMTHDSGLCTCDGINKGKKEAKRKMGIFSSQFRNGRCKNVGGGSK